MQCRDKVLTEFGGDRLENVPRSLAHTNGFYPYEAKSVKLGFQIFGLCAPLLKF